MQESLLQIKSLSKSFGGLLAVDNLSFEISEGEIKGIIGPNGSGKTTVFNIISGLFAPTEGTVFLEGNDITGLPMNKIAYLKIRRTFQQISLFKGLSVLKSVMIGAHPAKGCRLWDVFFNTRKFKKLEAELAEKSYNALKFVGLEDKAHHIATNLSYGQQRLVEIARALVSSPKLLLLDEPVAGMNQQEINIAKDIVSAISESGITVIVVEHNMSFIMDLAEKIAVLSSGVKITEESPTEIRSNPQVIECYLGRGLKSVRS